MNRARKKPVVIDFVIWNGRNQREMFDFLDESKDQSMTTEGTCFRIDFVNGGCQMGDLIIKTKEGEMLVDVCDYV